MNECESCPFKEAVERDVFSYMDDLIEVLSLPGATDDQRFNAMAASVELEKSRRALNRCKGPIADMDYLDRLTCGSKYIQSIMSPMLKATISLEPKEGWVTEE